MKQFFSSLLVIFVLSFAFADTYVLVHGAFQDASAWNRVVPLLQAEGHEVSTVNLRGRAGDETPSGEITLQDHVDVVTQAISSHTEPVILVAHSFGGIVASQAAELVPEKIDTLVYVAAYMPEDGQSMLELASIDHWSGISTENFVVAQDYSYGEILESDRVTVFCGDCTARDAELTSSTLLKEPLTPLRTPVSLSEENFGSVRKVYVETTADNAVSYLLQLIMQANHQVDAHQWLHTSHAPFTTMPDALVKTILSLVESN